jgi:hypothetical protein
MSETISFLFRANDKSVKDSLAPVRVLKRLYCLFHFSPNGYVLMFVCFGMADTHEGCIPMVPERVCFSLILIPITRLSSSLHKTRVQSINNTVYCMVNIDLVLNLTLLNVNYILIISLFFLLNNNPLVFVLRFRTFALGANVKYSVFSSLFCYLVFNHKTIECNVKEIKAPRAFPISMTLA